MNRPLAIPRVIALVLLVAVVCVAAYLGVWWLTRDTTDRNARVQQRTYGRQNALVEQILDDIRDAETPGIPAPQRVAIVDQVCDSAAKLTGSIQLPTNAANFIAQECPT
jgi:hypothetical protein